MHVCACLHVCKKIIIIVCIVCTEENDKLKEMLAQAEMKKGDDEVRYDSFFCIVSHTT